MTHPKMAGKYVPITNFTTNVKTGQNTLQRAASMSSLGKIPSRTGT